MIISQSIANNNNLNNGWFIQQSASQEILQLCYDVASLLRQSSVDMPASHESVELKLTENINFSNLSRNRFKWFRDLSSQIWICYGKIIRNRANNVNLVSSTHLVNMFVCSSHMSWSNPKFYVCLFCWPIYVNMFKINDFFMISTSLAALTVPFKLFNIQSFF